MASGNFIAKYCGRVNRPKVITPKNRVGGVNFNVNAVSRQTAMAEANHHFRPSRGAWFERGDNQFEWVSGNFFD